MLNTNWNFVLLFYHQRIRIRIIPDISLSYGLISKFFFSSRSQTIGKTIAKAWCRPKTTAGVQCQAAGAPRKRIQARQIPKRQQAHGSIEEPKSYRSTNKDVVPESTNKMEKTIDFTSEDRSTSRHLHRTLSGERIRCTLSAFCTVLSESTMHDGGCDVVLSNKRTKKQPFVPAVGVSLNLPNT